MKKILVATDFSACAGNAMDYAMELAKVLQAEVTALHAIGSLEGVFNNTYNALYIEEYHNSKRKALEAWAQTFTAKDGLGEIPVTTTCEVGSLNGVIGRYVDAHPVELLVMGTMGATGITGIFGSTASSVVEKIRIPTLVVPLGSKISDRPVITLATDFATPLSAEDGNALHELVQGTKSETLNVVNIIDNPEWKTNEAGEAQLRKLIPSPTVLEFKYLVEGNPIEGIVHFLVSSQTDILCVVKHHHNMVYRIFNTSTVNRVMDKAINSILVLHE